MVETRDRCLDNLKKIGWNGGFFRSDIGWRLLKKMRIISGKFKNKRIFFQKTLKLTVKDSVRENIFNILEHSKKIDIQIKNSNILDLYSGSGSFGLESLSRYANEVFFVEKDLDALKNLKKNIENFKIQKKAFLYSQSVFNFLENFNFYERFDLIFIDPPYTDKNILKS